jgi:hypothetical protein
LELYAKVIHTLDESIRRYLIHFTSVSPAMQGRLQRLTDAAKGPEPYNVRRQKQKGQVRPKSALTQHPTTLLPNKTSFLPFTPSPILPRGSSYLQKA